jgi:hypothetical protein
MSKTDYIYESLKDKFISSNIGKYILYFLFSTFILSLIPLSAIIIYMDYNHFFSYDFFIEGLFSQKIFFIYALVFISVCSIIFTGFVIIFIELLMKYKKFIIFYKILKKRNNCNHFKFILKIFFSRLKEKNYIKRKKIVIENYIILFFFGILCLIINISIFSLVFQLEHLKTKYNLYIISTIFSILFNIFLYSIFSKNIKFKFYALILTFVLTIGIMITSKDVTSQLLSKAFSSFSIGGLINVEVNEIAKDGKEWKGQLIFLTPKNVYLRDFDEKLILLERKNKEIIINKNDLAVPKIKKD